MGRHRGVVLVSPNVLRRILRLMQASPNKVFVASDFGSEKKIHLNTLKSLGLIERVDTIYRGGVRHTTQYHVDGWRLLKKEKTDVSEKA